MINSLVKSNLKSNKLKNIMTIITIALTTCLLTSVGMVTENLIKNQKEHIIKSYGNAHGFYRKLDQETVNKIKLHKDIEIVGENSIQLAKNEVDGYKYALMYVDENSIELSNMEVIEGRIPLKANEIALDKTILSVLGYSDTINQKINLKYHDINGNFITKDFVVTGILSKNISGEIYKQHAGIVSKEFIGEGNYKNLLKASIRIKGESKFSQQQIRDKISEIANKFDIDKDNIQFNDAYLSWMKPDPATVMGAIVIAIMIMVSSSLVIYNIFYISVVNRIQDFGKLKAIGATKKQIKSVIFKEGMILSIISIPIGVLLGYIISKLLINKLIISTGEVGIEYMASINGFIMVGCAILTLLTVFISLLKPMKVASKISPVEAMKYSESSSKNKTRKGYFELDILKMAKANLSRNRKRTLVTLLSLSLSGIVIMSASTAMGSVNTENMVKEGLVGDFKFDLEYSGYEYDKERENYIKNNPLNESFIDNIKSIDGVKDVSVIREKNIYIDNKGKLKEEEPELKKAEYSLGGYTDEMLNEVKDRVESGKIDIEKLKSGEEVIINTRVEHWSDIKVGDKVKIYYNDGNEKIEKEVKVQAIMSCHVGGDFITSLNYIKNTPNRNYNTSISISVDKHKEEQISKLLQSMSSNNKNLGFTSFKQEVENTEKSFFVMGSMGYVLVGIIGLISLVNLVNTMITGLLSRKKEIGILQAIGMTDNQLLKMLKLEGLFYTVTTVISSIGIGSIIGYITFKVMYNSGMTYATYKFPLLASIILILSMTIIQIFIGYFIKSIFKKESLIDRVRYSE